MRGGKSTWGAEREAICAQALGLAIGDTVLTESRGKPVRPKIEQMSVLAYDRKLSFHISGKRYRKDDLLGKRDESVFLHTESKFSRSESVQTAEGTLYWHTEPEPEPDWIRMSREPYPLSQTLDIFCIRRAGVLKAAQN